MAGLVQRFVADIRLFGQDAQAAAGGVHKDAVGLGQAGVLPGGIVAEGFDIGKAHPLHCRADEADAVLSCIAADETAGPLHFLGQQERLAAGGRAEVQHRFAGLCLHAERRQLAGLPFDVVVSLPEPRVLGRASLKCGQHTARHKARLGRCAQRRQLFAEGGGIGLERVDPQAGPAAVSRIGQDAQRLVRVMDAEEVRHIFPGRTKHHQPLGLIPEPGGAQVVGAGAAQHGIDQPRCAGFSERTGQLDRLIDGRRCGHLHIPGLGQSGA